MYLIKSNMWQNQRTESSLFRNILPIWYQYQKITSKFRKMMQIAHCDLHQKCKMKKKMMMFTESLAAQAESRLLCILLVCVPKRWKCLYMSMMIAATPSHAHWSFLMNNNFYKNLRIKANLWRIIMERLDINSHKQFQML